MPTRERAGQYDTETVQSTIKDIKHTHTQTRLTKYVILNKIYKNKIDYSFWTKIKRPRVMLQLNAAA